ncbi:MarR family winged helix-turn-helix transcriptional regulator [Casimicrobium huifangae]|uniref:MarR family winged helix-turn-helix transcriptional regulator n=1 Tax=Casimicrobium huifangae TaxID=2591109 RepID=UPI003784ED24
MSRRIRAFNRTAGETPGNPGVRSSSTSFLESLLGYNARRAALTIIEAFLERMSVFGLRPVDFSVLSLIAHNPGITSRQLCAALGILPPNLVKLISDLDKRGLLVRKPHPEDGRAIGLHLSAGWQEADARSGGAARDLEDRVSSPLSAEERGNADAPVAQDLQAGALAPALKQKDSMKHEDLIAIDIHTHAEVSCWNLFDAYGEEYDRAADKYFRSSRRPTIAETVAYYRERKIGLVMFTVDAEANLGRASVFPTKRRRRSQREQRHDDRVCQHRPAQGQDGCP